MVDFLDKGENLTNHATNAAVAVQAVGGIQDHIASKKNSAAKAASAAELEQATAANIALDAEKTVATGSRVATGLKGAWGVTKKIAGRIVTPLMALVGIFQTGKAIKKKDGHGAAKIAGGTAGSIWGMVAGDALTGFVLGTLFPGVGNVIGFIIGGVVGIGTMIFGGWLGSKVADGVAGNTLHKALNKGTIPVKSKTAPALQNVAAVEPVNESSFRERILNERKNKQQLPPNPSH